MVNSDCVLINLEKVASAVFIGCMDGVAGLLDIVGHAFLSRVLLFLILLYNS